MSFVKPSGTVSSSVETPWGLFSSSSRNRVMNMSLKNSTPGEIGIDISILTYYIFAILALIVLLCAISYGIYSIYTHNYSGVVPSLIVTGICIFVAAIAYAKYVMTMTYPGYANATGYSLWYVMPTM